MGKKNKMYRARVFLIGLMMRRNNGMDNEKKIHTKRYVVYKEGKKRKKEGKWYRRKGTTSPSVYKVQ